MPTFHSTVRPIRLFPTKILKLKSTKWSRTDKKKQANKEKGGLNFPKPPSSWFFCRWFLLMISPRTHGENEFKRGGKIVSKKKEWEKVVAFKLIFFFRFFVPTNSIIVKAKRNDFHDFLKTFRYFFQNTTCYTYFVKTETED